jgi:hypothetical protein
MGAVPKEVIIDVIEFVDRMKKENSSASYIAIKNAFKLFSIPVPVVTIAAGTEVFRLRIHEKPDTLYPRIQDLGHRLDRNGIIDFGRANEPLQSLFYCSDVRETAFCETSSLVRQNKKGLIEENTVGIWKLKRDLHVATLPKDNDHDNNPTVKYLNDNFNEFVAKNPDNDLLNLKFFLHRIAKEYELEHTSDNLSYLVTAAFANYVFETPMASFETKDALPVDGITYPSVHRKSKGMNLALKPELIENRDIELIKAVYNKMERVNLDTYAETLNIISENIDYDSYQIKWPKRN